MTRPLYPEEQAFLLRLRSRLALPVRLPVKVYWLFVLLLVGEVCFHLMSLSRYEGVFSLFGILTACSFAVVGYVPVAWFVAKKHRLKRIRAIDTVLKSGTVGVTPVEARRTALAMEHAREGDLWIIEYERDQLLFLWDYTSKLRRLLPRERFELYDAAFEPLFGRMVYASGPKTLPTFIDSVAKYRYFSRHGAPEQLSTAAADFEETVNRIGSL